MEAMLAAVRAADQDTLYSFYFPDGGRVNAAAVAGCVCLDDLTCTECERILGVSFLAIELSARKKQRRDPPVPVARVHAGPRQGLGLGLHAVEGSGKAISSGMVDRLGRVSRPPSDGIVVVEGSGEDISSMADRPGRGSRPASKGIEGPGAAISSVADRPRRGSRPASDGIEGTDAAVSSVGVADGLGTVSNGGVEVAISGIEAPPVPVSHPPSEGVEESDAAISGTADRLVPGPDPPSDGIDGSEVTIPSMADRLGPGSDGVVEGFEAGISSMANRLGLAAAVGERAKEVFRKMEEARAWPRGAGRGRGQSRFRSERPLVYAACLSIACRAEGSVLSLRELALAASAGGGVAKKDIAWLAEHIRSRLGKEEAGQGQSTGIGMACVSSYVRRFGELVGLREAEAAVALEAARRLEEGVVDVRHNVDTVAAAVVCVVLERAGAKRPGVKDVSAATGVSHATINTVCKKLRAHDGLLFV